ncbi:MAG TPA: acetyl-CoA carboxylase biotin carboxylase subunit [Candidatus Dormibacteraeota bacterium]|nr:acetyl-CoA carboxylase biotin carboxylase subunit [Candidatus Dormibacteraeota bacterium]
MFRKILVANRGEIAARIIRACREMGILTVAVYSEVDRTSLHVQMADEALPIGPAASRESYLSIHKIIDAARRTGCSALHPGYGFLAEDAALARACDAAGLVFIGPTPEAMERLGSKTEARQVARRAGVPTTPGALDAIADLAGARSMAREIGFPVLLKAVAGGGGKGMRAVESDSQLDGAWRDAGSEAANAFGDGRLYIEKYLPRPRHIEIQIFGDHEGHIVHLGERECSIQRRHQKVVEESPSPVVDPALRRAMGEAAVRLAQAASYRNAGTVEFLVDDSGRFYFLEVNTRLQVEHPVTESVTDMDLVKIQIRVAAGEPLPFRQEDVTLRGHAMECRIYAEDPENHFFPSPGRIVSMNLPEGPGIRNDVGVTSGWTVPGDYDPMLGKLIVRGGDRAETIARLSRALEEYSIAGIKTNLGLFRRLLREPEFLRGEFHTRWLDEWLARPAAPEPPAEAMETAAILAAVLAEALPGEARAEAAAGPTDSRWKAQARADQLENQPRR